jgi:hypothetical protein
MGSGGPIRQQVRVRLAAPSIRSLFVSQRKARGSNPHSCEETALAVRLGQPYPATFQSNQSPRQWTTGESNPDLLVASQASFRWTSSPFSSKSSKGPPENRTRSPFLQGRDAAGALADHHLSFLNLTESSRRESNPRSLFVGEVSLPLDHGTMFFTE